MNKEELKTLNDLNSKNILTKESEENSSQYNYHIQEFITHVKRGDVRSMVLDWIKNPNYMKVKSIRFNKCPKCNGKLEYTYEKTYDCDKCDEIWEVWELFLIEIFNLTEEDLK